MTPSSEPHAQPTTAPDTPRDASRTSWNAADRRTLETFLLDPDRAALPPPALLRRTRLAAWACTRLPSDHPRHAELRASLLTSATAHQTAVATLAPLVAAWRAAGLEVLAFKGFALALAAYDPPAARFYEDVDLLIRPHDAPAAERIAQRLGWTVRWSAARSGNAYAHETLHLVSPDGRLPVDVHRLILHSYAPWQALPRRYTQAAWRASREVPLGGTTVRLLDPRDALLIGLVLNRAWSTDGWRLKPRDYLDADTLARHDGVSEDALRARARELHCARTLDLVLDRCDPYRRHLDLRAPTRRQRLAWTLQTAHERRPYRVDQAANLALIAPGVIRDTLRELPGLVRVLRLLRHEPDLTRLLQRLDVPARSDGAAAGGTAGGTAGDAARGAAGDAAGATAGDTTAGDTAGATRLRRRWRAVRGVRWGLKLLRVRPEGDCLPRSLAVVARLRQLGWPAEFVSGVRRDDSGVLHGHAWVELDGRVLPELGEPLDARYLPNVRWPARDRPLSSSAAAAPPPPA